ncbi:MAG: transporter substrate-binding domain-containing protein [Deltaproteobacteria bacterium]|nr:transporter substrate-binding domain-containing protein [Deltaproteobacteria bacterium]
MLQTSLKTANARHGRGSRKRHLGAQALWCTALLLILSLAASPSLPFLAHAGEPPSGRTLLVWGDQNYPPYEFLDGEGRPAGYDVDIFRAVAKAMRLNAEIRLGPWDQVRKELEQGKIDVVIGMLYSAERDRLVDFSQPHLMISHAIFTRKDSLIRSEADLRGKEIIVQRGDIMHDYVREKNLTSRLVLVDSQPEGLRLLASGKHDCFLGAKQQGLYVVRKSHMENVVTVGGPFLAKKFGFAVPEGRTLLVGLLNQGLERIRKSGEYQAIYDKWFGALKPPGLPYKKILRYGLMILVPLVFVLSVVLLWTWSLRRRVQARTRELRESEEKYRLLVEHAGEAVVVAQEGVFRFANRKAEELLGYSSDELASKLLEETIHPDDRAMVLERHRRRTAGEEMPRRYSFRILRPEGDMRWVELHAASIQWEGKPATLNFLHDVTERRHAEEALRESESKFRTLFELSPQPIALVEWHSGKIVDFNEKLCDLAQYAAEEIIGRTPTELGVYSEEDAVRFAGLLKASGRLNGLEMEMKARDGSLISTLMFARRLRIGGESMVLLVLLDVTERNRLEEELRQAQKMESVGRLAGGVAHDLNNTLTAILGYTELALDEVDPNQPLHAELSEIRKAARRSAEFTAQLLAFARRQTIAPRILDLNEAVESILEMLRRLIGENIHLTWSPGTNLWPVKMDPAQIDQILANLCVNAKDAIADVGRITIETRNVTLDDALARSLPGSVPGDYGMLAVGDDGCGMEKSVLDQIFEPFFTTKEQGKGTGLGLATVYGIVKQNNGFIYAESEPNKGTRFMIYLPRHEGQASRARPEQGAGSRRGGEETVLVVEDEAAILKMVRSILERLGYRVITSGTPREAIEKAEQTKEPIHLLITDVIMPEMNGRDLAQRIRGIKPGIRCLFMSGYTADLIAHHGVLDEGVAFIQKPISLETLASKVREILDRK